MLKKIICMARPFGDFSNLICMVYGDFSRRPECVVCGVIMNIVLLGGQV